MMDIHPADDKLFDKYVVFRAPDEEGHGVTAYWERPSPNPRVVHGIKTELEEVDDFVFVLRPDVDPAAVVALAAYAAAVAGSKPQLSEDIFSHLPEWLGE